MRKRRLNRSDACWLAGVTLLLVLQFWWLPGNPGTPSDTYSATVEGKRGFFQTLESLSKAGVLPPVRREPNRLIPDQKSTLVILSPDRYPNENEQRELATFIRGGGTLLFAPHWATPDCELSALSIDIRSQYFGDEDLITPATVAPTPPPAAVPVPSGVDEEGQALPAEAEEVEGAEAVPDSMPKVAGSDQMASEPTTKPEDVLRSAVQPGTNANPPTPVPGTTADEDEDEENYSLLNIADFYTTSPLVRGSVPWRTRASMETQSTQATVLVKSTKGTVQAASWKYGMGRVVVSASADVFSNSSMLEESRAELAVRLVEHAHESLADGIPSETSAPIVLSEFLNSSDAYRGTAVLLGPALRSGTLQLITIAILAGWFGFHQFGPPRRTNAAQRRSLTESAAAVGNLQFRTNSGDEAVLRYLDYFKARLQRIFGRCIGIEDASAIASIATRAGMDRDVVKAMIDTASRAASQQGRRPASNSEAAKSIRDLSLILDKLSGGSAGR